jgi:class 3 adenylate cyclase
MIGKDKASSNLPEGSVTFLFTDIERSTELLNRLSEGYKTLLADQRSILRDVFSRWNGEEVDTQGDSFFVAFPQAAEALNACVEAQRLISQHAWPEGVEVRVRMGLHSGQPWRTDEGYASPRLATAGRCCYPKR